MTTTKQQNGRATESGNVLFLILIAVALFAALSYAVTQSSRSGGGDTGEKTLVSSSQITQYPASVRTSIVRMVIAGVSVDDILFDDPSNFSNLSTPALQAQGVFFPSPPGGGATYQTAPVDVMASGSQGIWIFSAKYQVKNIGSSTAGTGNEIIAFLPGVTKALCTKLDTQLGIALTSGLPPAMDLSSTPVIADNMDFAHPNIPASITGTIGSTTAALAGQPFGCFMAGSGSSAVYTYYHVLVER